MLNDIILFRAAMTRSGEFAKVASDALTLDERARFEAAVVRARQANAARKLNRAFGLDIEL